MELVAAVCQASHLVRQVAILLDLCIGVLEHPSAVLAHSEAQVVLQVRLELCFLHVLALEKVGLLSQDSLHVDRCVRLSIQLAFFVHLSGAEVLGVGL